MSHQTTLTATNSVPSTYLTANGLVTGDPIGVTITPLVTTGGNSTVTVSASSNCSATPTSITVTASSGTYSATFQNLWFHVSGVATIYAQTIISGTITPATSAPTTISLSAAGTASNSISVTATASGGTSGGTLQVSDNNSTWVTNGTSPSNKTRGTSYTFYGRRVLNSVASTSISQAYTPPYLATSTAGTISANDTTPAYTGNTSTVTLTIGSKAAGHNYYVDGDLVSGTSVDKTLPAAGGSTATYVLTVVRPTSYGGNGSVVSDGSVTVTRDPQPPTGVSFGAAPTTEVQNIGVPVSAVGGAGGTPQVQSSTGSGAIVNSGFTYNRNRGFTGLWRATRDAGTNWSGYTSYTYPYLLPAASGSLTGATIAYSASTTYTFGNPNVASTHDYRINSGTANSAAVIVPSAAGTYAFSLQTRRKVASGGDASTWSSSFGSVNIIRSADSSVSPPTAISLIPAGTESNSTTVTATTSGGTTTSGESLQVSDDNGGSWQANAYAFSGKIRGTTYAFLGKRVVSSVSSTTTSNSLLVPYLATAQTGALTAATIAYTASTSYTIGFSTAVPSTHDYRINSGTANSAAVTVPATAGDHPFSLQTRRKVASGGDPALTWSGSFGSVNITRSAEENNPNPNAFTFSDVPAATEGAVTTSNALTLAGMDIASTVTALNNCSYKIGSGSWQTTTGTAVPANSQITIRTTASSTYDATVTAYVTVGTTQSTTWSVTTRSDPATVDYGLQVMNANGTNEIFGYNVSTSHIVAHGSISVPHSSTVTVSNVEGLLVGNANTVGISVSATVPLFGIYLTSTRGTGQFTISNSSTLVTVVARYMVFRY